MNTIIGDIFGPEELENLFPKQIEALILLAKDPDLKQRLSVVAWNLGQELDDLMQELRLLILTKPETVETLEHLPNWLVRCSRNLCISRKRRTKTAQKYNAEITHISMCGKQGGGANPIWKSHVPTPEELSQRKEQYEWIALAVCRVCTQDEVDLIYQWATGDQVPDIARATNCSINTIYRHLKKAQKRVLAEISKESFKIEPPLTKAIWPLVARSLEATTYLRCLAA